MSALSRSRRASRMQLGLRLQIVLALAALLVLAFVPFFFAVASLTRATVVGVREESLRATARAIASTLPDTTAPAVRAAAERALRAAVDSGGVDAACWVDGAADGVSVCAGSDSEVAAMRRRIARRTASGDAALSPAVGVVDVTVGARAGSVIVRARAPGSGASEGALVRLVALYTGIFGLALLVFAYLVLTRLIVRPVDELVAAADRVANGARTLRVPRSGARELGELGASVQQMAEKLIGEEAALIVKVEELTEMTRRLTEAQAQLVRSERMASVGRLAAGIAHEIGNPLAALMGMQDLLLDGQLPPPEQREFVERMRRETQRIHTVVRDLLDFARPEEGPSSDRPVAAPAQVDVAVEDVARLVRAQPSFRGVTLSTEVPPDLSVALSPSRLTQVLLNLVLNAGAAAAGSKRPDKRVVVRGCVAGGRARIEVEDNGPGVAPRVRDRLFEPFVTTKEVGEGTGLGLAVCRGLVESAGGEIGLDASYVQGARFYVVLPLA